MSLSEGETLGLVGESGSGKTTVGRCILGLETADAGELVYRGQTLALPKGLPRALRPKMQIVFQDPFDSLDPRWTVFDLLGEPLFGRVLFAGEHTQSARMVYVDGAMASGVREAKRLLQLARVQLGPDSGHASTPASTVPS